MTTTLQIQQAKFDLVEYVERKVRFILQQSMRNQQNEIITIEWVDWPVKEDDDESKSEADHSIYPEQ
jgi:hypothetical protein